MTLETALWWVFAIFGPVPLVWCWHRWRAWRSARNVRETLAYRREKFGGFISEPGKREPTPLDRPPR